MNKVFAAITRSPKRSASILMVAAAVIVPAALFAWGPSRPTYTYDSPADHVVFDSMVNTPNYGDERNFVRIKDAAAANSTYTDDIALRPGNEYSVMVYYHNNARTSLNSADNGYKGIAQNAAMRIQMPATVLAGQKARITGFISADNAQPQLVWDEAYGSASNNIALNYVAGSATIYSNGAVNGQKMSDSLYTSGALIGYDKLDGKLPGCNQYAGFVVFKIKVDQPNFTVTKEVSLAGKNQYGASVTVAPGDKVDYKIHYANTGTTDQNNVLIKDQLPAGVTYVNGSTQVSNSASNNQWTPTTNNSITTGTGLNIGNYAAGGNAWVKFTAQIAANNKLATCGLNTLTNTATAETTNGSKSGTAAVMVTKECTTPITPTTPVTPTTPAELPHTGMSNSIVTVFGLGAMAAAAAYFVTSRRTAANK